MQISHIHLIRFSRHFIKCRFLDLLRATNDITIEGIRDEEQEEEKSLIFIFFKERGDGLEKEDCGSF